MKLIADMPRTKQFDVNQALDRAKDLFWEKGYEATSMDDLLRCMGINRGSFYDTFESKRNVMIASLRRYDENNRTGLIQAVSQGKSPRESILAVFRSMIDGTRGSQGKHGCYLVNSALETAPTDPTVARIVQSGFKDIERFFSRLVREAQMRGEIPPDLDADETGRALLTQLIGLLVLVRARSPKSVLDSVVNQAARLVG